VKVIIKHQVASFFWDTVYIHYVLVHNNAADEQHKRQRQIQNKKQKKRNLVMASRSCSVLYNSPSG